MSNILLVRNYCLLATTIAMISLGLTDLLIQPDRFAQKNRLNQYKGYLGVGLVAISRQSTLDPTWIPSFGKF